MKTNQRLPMVGSRVMKQRIDGNRLSYSLAYNSLHPALFPVHIASIWDRGDVRDSFLISAVAHCSVMKGKQ